MFNGTNVPCFGKMDGSISSTVTGGTAPYQYQWSNGNTTASITGVAAGYYGLTVKDATGQSIKVEMTLTEPEPLKVFVDPYVYPNGKNISCFECFNGTVDVQVEKGTPPYAYTWQDANITTQDRTGLGAKSYEVTVIDANGCVEKAAIALEQPESNDWKMGGNTGTDPATQYIGPSDNKAVVFKANDQESVVLKPNGDISLMGSLVGEGVLVRGADGKIRLAGEQNLPTLPVGTPCRTLDFFPYWETIGNTFSEVCPEVEPLLGKLGAMPLKIVTNGIERMRITTSGSVAIGSTSAPETKLHVQGDLLVRGADGDIITSSNSTTGPVLWARNSNGAIGLSLDPGGVGHIVKHWDAASILMTFKNDQVEVPSRIVIGDVQPRDGYRLFVQEGILTERVKVAIRTEDDWEDKVFRSNYGLMPLNELQRYVQKEHHLPGIPSAKEMVSNGLDVAQMDALLLKKVEELTLHIIAMDERIMAIEKENVSLRVGSTRKR